MSRASDLVGKECQHSTLGRVFVESASSRVKVNIMVLQRAEGWNSATETYQRYKVTPKQLNGSYSGLVLRWNINRESNDQYGHKDVVHINNLTVKK